MYSTPFICLSQEQSFCASIFLWIFVRNNIVNLSTAEIGSPGGLIIPRCLEDQREWSKGDRNVEDNIPKIPGQDH